MAGGFIDVHFMRFMSLMDYGQLLGLLIQLSKQLTYFFLQDHAGSFLWVENDDAEPRHHQVRSQSRGSRHTVRDRNVLLLCFGCCGCVWLLFFVMLIVVLVIFIIV